MFYFCSRRSRIARLKVLMLENGLFLARYPTHVVLVLTFFFRHHSSAPSVNSARAFFIVKLRRETQLHHVYAGPAF